MISVVIPLYNKGAYVTRALKSVLSQSIQDFEIIVVDDGSTDDGPQIVKNIPDERIKLIQQQNAGVSAARNRGIKEAKANLIAFLDADDAWESDFLETVRRLKKKFPRAGAYATAYKIKYPNGKIAVPKFRAIPTAPWEGLIPGYFRSALGPPPVWSSAVTVHKWVFDDVGQFPEGIPLGEDLDMWARIAMRYPMAFSTKICAVYHKEFSTSNCLAGGEEMCRLRPVVYTLKHALEKDFYEKSGSNDIRNYMNKLIIDNCLMCLVWGNNPIDSRSMLNMLEINLTNPHFFLKRVLIYFLSYLPSHIVRFLFEVKQILI